jgi:hypothetical protein
MSDQKISDIKSLVQRINALEKEVGKIDFAKLEQFISTTINGDDFVNADSLVIPAQISKDKSGILVYIITSAKLVKIQIDNEGFKSSSTYLNQVSSVERSLTEGRAAVEIKFGQDSFGLRYSPKHTEISDFFTKVEEAVRKTKKVA